MERIIPSGVSVIRSFTLSHWGSPFLPGPLPRPLFCVRAPHAALAVTASRTEVPSGRCSGRAPTLSEATAGLTVLPTSASPAWWARLPTRRFTAAGTLPRARWVWKPTCQGADTACPCARRRCTCASCTPMPLARSLLSEAEQPVGRLCWQRLLFQCRLGGNKAHPISPRLLPIPRPKRPVPSRGARTQQASCVNSHRA